MSNRLAGASSAYLRSAAHQPIDWYEFGPEAFEKAKELDKPILLDIGAVWCHWCHVIDRESYDDPDIAELINQHYIAIKVDRDQRPDVDARYQHVVQSMTGQGGWPLTGFLTYDGRLIHGGTYFPPETMKMLLEKINELYHQKKADIFSPEEILSDEKIEAQNKLKSQMDSIDKDQKQLNPDILNLLPKSADRMFDSVFGGFGTMPKFPHFSGLEYLIHHAVHLENQSAGAEAFTKESVLNWLNLSLTQMAKGGIYDQVAGGFHRYSVDREWHVPHFEKMAYDNAEALKVYAQAYHLTNNPLYKEIAEGIIDWVNRDLSDQERGGFYASQDADIDLEDDGDHFTWTLDEVKAVLLPNEAELVCRYYDVTEKGDMHERPGRNVLRIKAPLTEAEEETLAIAKAKLLAKRLTRPIPFIDTTLYTNWNGMMLVGYFEAADLLDRSDVRDFAVKTLDRLIAELYTPEAGFQHVSGVTGFLEDQAWMSLALLKAYQSTANQQYYDLACELINWTIAEFGDFNQPHAQGGFFDTRESKEAIGLLKFRRKAYEDTPSSSGNGVMVQVLSALSCMTANIDESKNYRTLAEQTIASAGEHLGYGIYAGAILLGARMHLQPSLKIELVGDAQSAYYQALAHAARTVFWPAKLIQYNVADTSTTSEARLCVGTHCLPPVKNKEALLDTLKTLQNPALV